jgi:4-hydroxy-2-oxoheptanedioate aldolase
VSELGNVLRARIAEGRVVGTFLKLVATETIDLAAAHLDFAVVDLEHSQLDHGSAGRLVRHARALAFPAVVRVAWPERERINRLLEAGAAGIQLSTVRRAESVDLRQDRDRVKARIDEIIAVAADAGIALGGAGVQAPAIRYDVIGSDIAMLRAGFARTAVNPVTSP